MNEHIWIAHHLTMIAVYAERHELRDVPEVIYKAAGAVSRAIRSAGRLAHHSSEDRADINFMRLQRTHVQLAVSNDAGAAANSTRSNPGLTLVS